MRLCSLLLLMSMSSLKRELGVRPRCHRPWWNLHQSLSGMVMAGAGGDPALCLLGEGEPPSPPEAMWNSLVESPIMAPSGDDGQLWVEPMMMASEPSPLGERLRPLKHSAMNLRLPKRMVWMREKQSHDRCSLSAATKSTDEGTIEISRGKERCKSPFLVHQLSVFVAPIGYRVVKIMCSSSKVVLRTT
jgi:hypothetical protein